SEALRDGPWKLVVQHPKAKPGTFANEQVELFRLDKDISEKTNLAATEPKRAAAMLKQLKAWYAETQETATYQPGGWLKAATAKEQGKTKTNIPQAKDRPKVAGPFIAAEGLKVETFATEQLSNPASIDVDDRGRVWVAEALNYRKKIRKEGDRILILEDSDGDGRADRSKVFYQDPDIDGVHGVCVLGNKAIVSAPDRIIVLTDTNGDDKADEKKLLFMGKVMTGPHGQHDHAVHAAMFGPDGRLYFNFGNYNAELRRADGTLVKDVFGNPVNNSRQPYQEGMVIRCELDGSRVEVLGHNFRNNWEVTVDSFGSMWQSDNDNGSSSCRVNFVMEYGNYGYRDEKTGADYGARRTNMEATMQRQMWHQNDPGVVPNLLITGSGAPTGILVYEGDLLPEQFHGQMIHAEPGRNRVWAFPTQQAGAGYSAHIVDLAHSDVDRDYRPSDISVAPDGSLFIADWFDPVDCCHRTINDAGRIFRVAPPEHTYAVPDNDYQTPETAVKALRSPNLSVRYQAWTALVAMQTRARPVLELMAADSNPRFRARALWVLAAIRGGADKAIEIALRDKTDDVRALALRIARRHRLPVEPLVRRLVRDESAVVRRECAVSLHRLDSPESVQLWVELATQYDGTDRWYLEALGIGEVGKEAACLDAWLKKTGDAWKASAGRDIVWRSRAPKAAMLLAGLLLNPDVAAAEHPRLLRSLDFHAGEKKQAALTAILSGDANRSPATYLEAFKRATPEFLKAHPEVMNQVQSALLASKGTVTFVDLVARFNRRDMIGHLMDMAQTQPEQESGIRAVAQVMAFKEWDPIWKALANPDRATPFIKAIGYVGTDDSRNYLLGVVTNESQPEATRLLAIAAMGQTSISAQALMKLVQENRLPKEFLAPAIRALTLSPNPDTRLYAARQQDFLVPVEGRWPLEKLLATQPDSTNGFAAFQKGGCIKCHKIGDQGKDFGPDLSAIGTKLTSEQMFEAILNPSQTISLGYEGVLVVTDEGTLHSGFVSAETKDTLSLRIPGGLRKEIPKANIELRKPMTVSAMPAGIDAVLTPRELVDVVGWLRLQLAKKPNSQQQDRPASSTNNARGSEMSELFAPSIHGSPHVNIAVPNGPYTLQLLLYEGWRSRSADIVIEGKTVRAAYDMFKEQGGNFDHGSVLRHTFTLTDGNIDIEIKGPLHLGGLILSKGKTDSADRVAIVKHQAALDLKDVIKAINFGDTKDLNIGDVKFIAAAVNTTVDGVTNTAGGDVYSGEFGQKLPRIQKEKAALKNTKFFNGKDLTGWKGTGGYWSVKDGAIVGHSEKDVPKNEFIWSDVEVKDFYLTVDVKLTPDDRNAGIQFRSKPVDAHGQAIGYQADVGAGVWGKLYHEHGRGKLDWNDNAAGAVKPGQWNTYEILAVGDRIWTAINGKLCVAIEDPTGERAGKIAFQIHGGAPQTVHYRNPTLKHNPKIALEKQTKEQLLAALPKKAETPEPAPPKPISTPLPHWTRLIVAVDPGSQGEVWAKSAFDHSTWKTMKVPGHFDTTELPGFDGVVWFRKTIELSTEQAKSKAILHLGQIDDMDVTWVNGTRVGGYENPGHHYTVRKYPIPAGLLKTGKNTIAVRVMDHGAPGGIAGTPEQLFLQLDDERVSLANRWQFAPGANLAALNAYGQVPALVRPLARPKTPVPAFAGGFTIDHDQMIVVLGGTNALESGRHGYLETLLTAAHPQHQVRVRNLAWQADTVYQQQRPRNFYAPNKPDYGERDDRAKIEADIVFFWMGQTESLDGPDRVVEFTAAYKQHLDHIAQYTKRIVLVTPVPFSNPLGLDIDIQKRNDSLAVYVDAIRKIGRDRKLPVVDLAKAFGWGATPLPHSQNGLHLLPDGHWDAAQAFASQLGFADRVATIEWYDDNEDDPAGLEP
ncbi:MAG: hypothetical protein CMJ90_16685, partial [Planctomycetes bacterium]|nr:hypothetical protein [Planctomycetota bacterium]